MLKRYLMGSSTALPTKRVKEVKRSLFQSFQKPAKNVVKPANPRIRRFFAFKAVFKLCKNTQKFCGKIVAKLRGKKFCHKIVLKHL